MPEKIEVGYRHIGTIADVEYHHKFLLYTNKNGQQYTISGWTDDNNQTDAFPFGNIRILTNEPYDRKNPDSFARHPNQKQYRELITEAPDLSAKWAEMVRNARSKDNIYPYDPIRQNSNTLADTVLREAGLPEPRQDTVLPQDHLAPGSGNKLDKNLVPKSQDELGISDLRHVISMEENIRQQEGDSRQYAQAAREPTFSDMPANAQELCRQCREHLVNYYHDNRIAYTEEQLDRTATALGVAGYANKMPAVQGVNITAEGQIFIGHETQNRVLTYASMDAAQAAVIPVADSIAQSKQMEIDLARAHEQRQQEILAYQQSPGISMGRSIWSRLKNFQTGLLFMVVKLETVIYNI